MKRMDEATRQKCHGNPAEARRQIDAGHQCDDCDQKAETMILTADSCDLVCYGCWSERHRRMGEELAKDPTKHMRAFHERAARAYDQVGDHDMAEQARTLAASL